MALHVALTHRTDYSYDRLTGLATQIVRLRPAPHTRTPILSYSLTIEPKDHFINWQQDPFGNYLARLVFPEKTREFKVAVDLVADMATINPFDFFVDEYARDWQFDYEAALKEELTPYLKAPEPGPLLRKYLRGLRIEAKTSLDFIWALQSAASARHPLSHPHGGDCVQAGARSERLDPGQAFRALKIAPHPEDAFGVTGKETAHINPPLEPRYLSCRHPGSNSPRSNPAAALHA